MTKEIVTFKGFNKDLKCRDFQFEIGKTFHHDGKVEACGSGFHACEFPFRCFQLLPSCRKPLCGNNIFWCYRP
ncbi:TPA: DUF7666 domain-containing protein [Salmonella enterica subsp. enterica serovar Enteritidis]|uniref:DUF7666 domain-containing protein n=1 Tax=Salmonella enterica TaxID=28901 RepID=UPI003CFB0BC7